jgi:hypothetical protein
MRNVRDTRRAPTRRRRRATGEDEEQRDDLGDEVVLDVDASVGLVLDLRRLATGEPASDDRDHQVSCATGEFFGHGGDADNVSFCQVVSLTERKPTEQQSIGRQPIDRRQHSGRWVETVSPSTGVEGDEVGTRDQPLGVWALAERGVHGASGLAEPYHAAGLSSSFARLRRR